MVEWSVVSWPSATDNKVVSGLSVSSEASLSALDTFAEAFLIQHRNCATYMLPTKGEN